MQQLCLSPCKRNTAKFNGEKGNATIYPTRSELRDRPKTAYIKTSLRRKSKDAVATL